MLTVDSYSSMDRDTWGHPMLSQTGMTQVKSESIVTKSESCVFVCKQQAFCLPILVFLSVVAPPFTPNTAWLLWPCLG